MCLNVNGGPEIRLQILLAELHTRGVGWPKIIDEFTDLPVSPQRKTQLRMARARRCIICGKPAVMGRFCLKHRVKERERQRKRLGLKRRYYGTLSYRLEAQAKAAARRKRSKTAK